MRLNSTIYQLFYYEQFFPEPFNSLLFLTMCFGGFSSVKPKPPRREKHGDNEEKYLSDYALFEEKDEQYTNKDNRRRRMANSNTGTVAGTSAAWIGMELRCEVDGDLIYTGMHQLYTGVNFFLFRFR